jgi:hypothetical protein
MRFHFREGPDGTVDVVLGAEYPLFARALSDAATTVRSSRSSGSRLSTYWIDTTLALLRRHLLTGRDGPITGDATSALHLVGDSVVALDERDDANRESVPAALFEDLLVQWRARIRAVQLAPAHEASEPAPSDER